VADPTIETASPRAEGRDNVDSPGTARNPDPLKVEKKSASNEHVVYRGGESQRRAPEPARRKRRASPATSITHGFGTIRPWSASLLGFR